MAAQYLLRQARPALVRIGVPLLVGRRAGDRPVSAAAFGLGCYAAAVAGISGRDLRVGANSDWGAFSLCNADWRRPFRVPAAGFLLAAIGAAGGGGHSSLGRKAGGRVKPIYPPLPLPQVWQPGKAGLCVGALCSGCFLRQRAARHSAIRGGQNTRTHLAVAYRNQ